MLLDLQYEYYHKILIIPYCSYINTFQLRLHLFLLSSLFVSSFNIFSISIDLFVPNLSPVSLFNLQLALPFLFHPLPPPPNQPRVRVLVVYNLLSVSQINPCGQQLQQQEGRSLVRQSAYPRAPPIISTGKTVSHSVPNADLPCRERGSFPDLSRFPSLNTTSSALRR